MCIKDMTVSAYRNQTHLNGVFVGSSKVLWRSNAGPAARASSEAWTEI